MPFVTGPLPQRLKLVHGFGAVAFGVKDSGFSFFLLPFYNLVLGVDAGTVGAALATIAIFAPGFLFVAVSQPLIPRLRASALTGALLDGVVVASLGLMAAVTWHLGRSAIVDAPTAGLAVVAAAILVTLRPNSAWLVLGGAVAGWSLRGGT